MQNSRKHRSPHEKLAILKKHLVDKIPISDVCDEYGILPTMFHPASIACCAAPDSWPAATIPRPEKAKGSSNRCNLTNTGTSISRTSISPVPSTTHHLRQRASVHRQGFQGVHSHRWNDPREDLSVLPAIEWKNRAISSHDQRRLHSPRHPNVARRCPTTRGSLCHTVQQHAAAQCHRIYAHRSSRRAPLADVRRTRSSPSTRTRKEKGGSTGCSSPCGCITLHLELGSP